MCPTATAAYIGLSCTQEEAAEAYDIAAIKFRGLNAVTNFDMSRYDIKSIATSSLPTGGMSSRTSKATEATTSSEPITIDINHQIDGQDSSSFGFSVLPVKPSDQEYWSLLALHHQQQQQQQLENNQSLGFGLFPSGVNMDFTAPTVPMNQGLVWNNGIWQQEQQPAEQSQSSSTTSSSIPYATLVDGYAANYDGSYVGSWVTPPPAHTYYHQAAKPNVGFYQTPICGME